MLGHLSPVNCEEQGKGKQPKVISIELAESHWVIGRAESRIFLPSVGKP
jgi:hypothetical protein